MATPFVGRNMGYMAATLARLAGQQGWLKVVAHTKNGECRYGLCNAIETDAPSIELLLYDREGKPLNRRSLISYDSLKAVFIVKDFEGNMRRSTNNEVEMPPTSPIALEFSDGEIIIGRPVETGWEQSAHLLVCPEDLSTNNNLIIAERSAVKAVCSYDVYRRRQQQEFNAYARDHFKPGESQDECLGDYYFSKHNFARALEHFRIALEQDPSNRQVRHKLCVTKYNIGVRCIKRKDYAQALRYMELVLALDPSHEDALDKAQKLRERLRVRESLENVQSHQPSCTDSLQLRRFVDSTWVYQHHHFVLTGPPGSGKTRLACSLGHKVSKKGLKVIYHRLPNLVQELQAARVAGKDVNLMLALEKADFLIFDDWKHDLMREEELMTIREVITSRYLRRATLFIAEMDGDQWHRLFGDHVVSDPILNKVLNDAHKIHLERNVP